MDMAEMVTVRPWPSGDADVQETGPHAEQTLIRVKMQRLVDLHRLSPPCLEPFLWLPECAGHPTPPHPGSLCRTTWIPLARSPFCAFVPAVSVYRM